MQWYNNNVPNVLLAPFQSYTDERAESSLLKLNQIIDLNMINRNRLSMGK